MKGREARLTGANRQKNTPEATGLRDVVEKKQLISWRTEVRGGRPSGRTTQVFELFFLDIPGFSGYLLLSYPVCGP